MLKQSLIKLLIGIAIIAPIHPISLLAQNKRKSNFGIDQYLKTYKKLITIDSLIANNKYAKALKALERIKTTPDFDGVLYFQQAYCHAFLKDDIQSKAFFKKCIFSGYYFKGISYTSKINSENKYIDPIVRKTFQDLRDSIDIWHSEYMSSIDITLRSSLLKMKDDDQAARRLFNNDTSQLGNALFIDQLNQFKYDSLFKIHGWFTISKTAIFNQADRHIILWHSDSHKQLEYINLGYNLATQADIGWMDLIMIQSFLVLHSRGINDNYHSIVNFSLHDMNYNKFIVFSLKNLLADAGISDKKTNRIVLYFNASKNSITKTKALHFLHQIRKLLVLYGIDKNQVTIAKEYYYTDKLYSNNGPILLRFNL
jgi:hypothetical protein